MYYVTNHLDLYCPRFSFKIVVNQKLELPMAVFLPWSKRKQKSQYDTYVYIANNTTLQIIWPSCSREDVNKKLPLQKRKNCWWWPLLWRMQEEKFMWRTLHIFVVLTNKSFGFVVSEEKNLSQSEQRINHDHQTIWILTNFQ